MELVNCRKCYSFAGLINIAIGASPYKSDAKGQTIFCMQQAMLGVV